MTPVVFDSQSSIKNQVDSGGDKGSLVKESDDGLFVVYWSTLSTLVIRVDLVRISDNMDPGQV